MLVFREGNRRYSVRSCALRVREFPEGSVPWHIGNGCGNDIPLADSLAMGCLLPAKFESLVLSGQGGEWMKEEPECRDT